MKIYIDGKYYDKADAKVSVFDHGLLYGDGVFEGIRVYNGKVFRLKEHIDRLYESAKSILLEIPITKEEMESAVLDAVNVNERKEGYIRLVVTRGEGGLGLDPASCKKAYYNCKRHTALSKGVLRKGNSSCDSYIKTYSL